MVEKLTAWGQCVLEELVKLAEVHDHTESVRFTDRRHLLDSHHRRDAKLLLCHLQPQPHIHLPLILPQRGKVTAEKWNERVKVRESHTHMHLSLCEKEVRLRFER